MSPPDLIFALPITQILFLTVGLLSEPDFRYWDDASDEYRQLEGSLLPLWKFSCDKSRSFVVSSLSWSPAHHDLFAASYTAGKTKRERGGRKDKERKNAKGICAYFLVERRSHFKKKKSLVTRKCKKVNTITKKSYNNYKRRGKYGEEKCK